MGNAFREDKISQDNSTWSVVPSFHIHSSLNSKKVFSCGSHSQQNPWRWGRTLVWRFWVRLEDTLCSYRQPAGYDHHTIPPWQTIGISHGSATAFMEALLPLLKTSTTEGKADTTPAMLPSKAVPAWAEGEMRGERRSEVREHWDRKVFAGGSDWALRQPGNDWGHEVQLEAAVKVHKTHLEEAKA